MNPSTAILWFRQDLRLTNNPALTRALASHQYVIPVYIYAPCESQPWAHGAASRWWLHHSLESLNKSLHERGSRLIIRQGNDSLAILKKLSEQSNATHIYWNRLYEPAHIKRDKYIKQALRAQSISTHSFNSTLLNEPWQITKADGSPYKVFTPFWKACVQSGLPMSEHLAPCVFPEISSNIKSAKIESLQLLPHIRWNMPFSSIWHPGEQGAQTHIEQFLSNAATCYKNDRNHPDVTGTSMLSPHLHFGEISPQQIIAKTNQHININKQPGIIENTDVFIREIGWREFAYYLLYHYPLTTEKALHDKFSHFPWEKNYSQNLEAWQKGLTGIPLIDAGMRQLWHTGWMHNRVRMIVASVLTKNMLIPWQEGAKWFWDTLVDADLANNTLGWQWTAGCGADAAPYFRIFNPVIQSEKFDLQGKYIRQWIPEIAKLPNKYLYQPWSTPTSIMHECAIKLGTDYPKPVIDLKETRSRALQKYSVIK